MTSDKTFVLPYFFLNIVPTPECNCNCDYCEGRIDPIQNAFFTTRGDYDYILKECVSAHQNGLIKKFHFSLRGGEPLLRFNEFKESIGKYKREYPDLFSFSMAINGTIMNDEIAEWIYTNLDNLQYAIDTLKFSKPINGISTHELQLENLKKLKRSNTLVISSSSVFYDQPIEDMIEMTEFASEHFDSWYFAVRRPFSQTKEEILQFSKPVLKTLYEHNFYTPDKYSFEGWDLWNKKCLGDNRFKILGLNIREGRKVNVGDHGHAYLGDFNSDILSFINHPANRECKSDTRPDMCKGCELRDECDGGWNMNHKNVPFLKERCDAIKELFEYVQTLGKE